MKVTKNYLRKLILESLNEIESDTNTTTLEIGISPKGLQELLFTMRDPNKLLGLLTYSFANKYPELIPKEKEYLTRTSPNSPNIKK